MYICVYASMYLCIYVSMCLCFYASMFLCVYVSMYYLCMGFPHQRARGAPPSPTLELMQIHLAFGAERPLDDPTAVQTTVSRHEGWAKGLEILMDPRNVAVKAPLGSELGDQDAFRRQEDGDLGNFELG